jgi:hypothetical protein
VPRTLNNGRMMKSLSISACDLNVFPDNPLVAAVVPLQLWWHPYDQCHHREADWATLKEQRADDPRGSMIARTRASRKVCDSGIEVP